MSYGLPLSIISLKSVSDRFKALDAERCGLPTVYTYATMPFCVKMAECEYCMAGPWKFGEVYVALYTRMSNGRNICTVSFMYV